MVLFTLFQPLARIPKLFVPSVACPECSQANDEDFMFCQRCGYKRKVLPRAPTSSKRLRFPIDNESIQDRLTALDEVRSHSRYAKQKSSLEGELGEFLWSRCPPKTLESASPKDIVEFLVWKDQGGRTVIHNPLCCYVGDSKRTACSCPRRLAHGTVDSLIGKLRAIFASHGRGGEWFPLLGVGNPAADKSVQQYLVNIREEQVRVHVTPRQADPIFLCDLEVLGRYWRERLRESVLDPTETFVLARDQALFKALFFSADRAADLLGILTSTIWRFPDDSGLLLNQVWTKSLRSGDANVFALKRGTNKVICPVVGLDLYFNLCKAMRVDISTGYVFRSVSKQGLITAKALGASAAQARLNVYVKDLKGSLSSEHITMHGFRSGAAISMALANVSLDQIMDHVGWKSSKTALHYIKLKQVVNPAGPAARLANLDTSVGDDYLRMDRMKGFMKAFP